MKNKNHNIIIYSSLIFFLCLFINPIYLLPLIVILRPYKINFLIVIVDLIVITSYALLFSSRDYGISWGVANDDAIIYIETFNNFHLHGFNNYKSINITANIEYLFYFYTHILSIITFGSENLFKFLCIFLPLSIYYLALYRLSPFNSLIILSFMMIMLNPFIHLIFHTWRASLGSSITALALSNYISNRSFLYLIILSIMAHVSSLFNFLLITSSHLLKSINLKCMPFIIVFVPFLIIYMVISIASYVELGDRNVYIDGNESFSFQNSYIVFFILVLLIWKQLNTYFLKYFAMTILGTLLLPFLLPSYATIISRIIELACPLLFLVFATTKLFHNKIFLFIFSLFSISILFKTIRISDFVTDYIAYGNYLNFYSGFIIAISY